MTDAISRRVGQTLVNGATQGLEGAVARREAGAAVDAGATLARRELSGAATDGVEAGASALRRGAPTVPTAPGVPGAAMRAPAATAPVLTAEHQAANRTLEDLTRSQARCRPGSPEYSSWQPQIDAARRDVTVHATLASVQTQRAAVQNLAAGTPERLQRSANLALGNAEKAHADALLAAGHPLSDATASLRNAGRAFDTAGRRDLTDTGRVWASDLQSSLMAYGRAGDAQGALRALGMEGRVTAAATIVRGTASLSREESANAATVARRMIDDQRSRPFVSGTDRIPARPPLTDAQWREVRPMLAGSQDPVDILRTINAMP